MVYTLSFSKLALKQLEKINDPYYSHLKESIIALTQNPRPQGCKKLKGRNGFRIRVGNYRVIYDVFDGELVVEIIALGHRKDIYD